jgi:hypothetical protein
MSQTAILALPYSTYQFANATTVDGSGWYFNNHRRQIFWRYPRGGCPLTGILSVMTSTTINQMRHIWYEYQYKVPYTLSRGTNPLTSTAPSTGDADDGTAAADGAKAISTNLYLKVATTNDMRPGIIIQIGTSETQYIVQAVTVGVADPALLGYIKVNPVRAYTQGGSAGQVPYSEFAAGAQTDVFASTQGEGNSGLGLTPTSLKLPYGVDNVVQIHETPFQLPVTTLQAPVKYDQAGPWQKHFRDNLLAHTVGMERQNLLGKRSSQLRPSFDTNQGNLPTYTISGLLEYMQLWDAGSTGISIDGSTYAPYSFKGPDTLDTDDGKRVITNSDGLVTLKRLDVWMERVQRYNNNMTMDRLVFMGPRAFMALSDLCRKTSTQFVKPDEYDFGLGLKTIQTAFGKMHCCIHPLFADDPIRRYWMWFIDVWSMRLLPFQGLDTELRRNVQLPKATYREDMFVSGWTLEVGNVCNTLLVRNVANYATD